MVRAQQHHPDTQINSPDSDSEHEYRIAMPAARHFVQFYDADPSLLDAVATYCADSIVAGDTAIVIATPEHRAGVADRLRARNLIDTEGNHGRYLALDAAETLTRFFSGGEIDIARFTQVIGDLISGATEHGRQVRVFGEMVSLLVETGNPGAAIHLEELWNDLQERGTHPFTLLCAYPLAEFGGEARGQLFRDVCETHAKVIPAESFMAASNENDRLRAIAELQQKAQSLEAEIAERQRVEAQLQGALVAEQSARRESENALHIRDAFLSIAAHELRNPLASLSLHAQVALRRLSQDSQADAARTERSLQAITDQAARLSHLLDRLLDVTRLDAGQLILERRPTDLALLAEQAVASARAKSDEHPITLERLARPDVEVDPLRLKQVLTNLLDNAIKYSPEGEPIVVTLSQPVPGSAELAVTDHGIGIPPEARPRIFERFFQARDDDAAQGLGLGLYVSQQIVESHGGQIRAEFPSHGGTRFVVSLPLEGEKPSDLLATG